MKIAPIKAFFGSQHWANLISFIALCVSAYTYRAALNNNKESEKFRIKIRAELNYYRDIEIYKTQTYAYHKGDPDLFIAFPIRVTIVNISKLPQYLQSVDVRFDKFLEIGWGKVFQPNNNNKIRWPQKIESMQALDLDILLYYPLNEINHKQFIWSNLKKNVNRSSLGSMSDITSMDFNRRKQSLENELSTLTVRPASFLLNFLSPSNNEPSTSVSIDLKAPIINKDVFYATIEYDN